MAVVASLCILLAQAQDWQKENFAREVPAHLRRSKEGRLEWIDLLGSRRWSQPGPVRAVAFLPDGKRAVSGGDDGAVRLWEVETGREIASWRIGKHSGAVTALAALPTGSAVLSSSRDGTVKLWDAETGRCRATAAKTSGAVLCIAIDRDGTRAASGGEDGTVRIWKLPALTPLAVGRGHTRPVSSLAFHPTQPRLVSGSWDGSVRIWDADLGGWIETPANDKADWIRCVAWDAGGAVAWAGGSGWSSASRLGEAIAAMAFSKDGRRLATGSREGFVRIWVGGVEARRPFRYDVSVNALAWSPASDRLLVGLETSPIRLEDLRDPRPSAEWKERWTIARGLYFSPNHREIFYGSKGRLYLRDAGDGSVRTKWPGGTARGSFSITRVWLLREQRRALTLNNSNSNVELWDLRAGGKPAVIADCNYQDPGRVVEVSPSGRFLFLADETGARLLSLSGTQAREVRRFPSLYRKLLDAVVFSPDENRIVVGVDRQIVALRIPNGEIASRLRIDAQILGLRAETPAVVAATERAFLFLDLTRPEGRVASETRRPPGAIIAVTPSLSLALLAPAKGIVTLCSIPEGKRIRTWRALAGRIRQAAFRDDGKVLATVGEDDVTRLWRMDDQVKRASSPPGLTTGALLSDGRTLVAAGNDGSLLLFDRKNRRKRIRIALPHRWPVRRLAASRRGAAFWALRENGVLERWTARDGGFESTSIDFGRPSLSLAISPNEKRAFVGHRGIEAWDLARGAPQAEYPTRTMITALALDPSGKLLATGGWSGSVTIRNAENGALNGTMGDPASPIVALAFDPPGARLLAGERNGTVGLWEVAAQRRISTRRIGRPCRALAFANQDRFWTLDSGGTLALWSPGASKPVDMIETDGGAVDLIVNGNEILLLNRNGTIAVYRLR